MALYTEKEEPGLIFTKLPFHGWAVVYNGQYVCKNNSDILIFTEENEAKEQAAAWNDLHTRAENGYGVARVVVFAEQFSLPGVYGDVEINNNPSQRNEA